MKSSLKINRAVIILCCQYFFLKLSIIKQIIKIGIPAQGTTQTKNVLNNVPIPTFPPRSQPKKRTVAHSSTSTMPIGSLDNLFPKPIKSASCGPQHYSAHIYIHIPKQQHIQNLRRVTYLVKPRFVHNDIGHLVKPYALTFSIKIIILRFCCLKHIDSPSKIYRQKCTVLPHPILYPIKMMLICGNPSLYQGFIPQVIPHFIPHFN